MKTLKGKNSESGVAMMMALVTMFLLAILAGEIVYQSGVFSSVVFRQRDQLRATLLARSGLRMALLQLRAAKKAKAKGKSLGLGDNTSLIDKIWQTPLILPPPNIPGLSDVDSAALDSFRKSLGIEGVINVHIMAENGRMSINQLVWPLGANDKNNIKGVSSGGDILNPDPLAGKGGANPNQPPLQGTSKEQFEELKKKTKESFVEIFNNLIEKKKQEDDAFREKYANLTGERLLGDIQAWLDIDAKTDGDGRDKQDYYSRAEPNPYSLKDAPIASMSELHMIKGIDDTLAKLISDNFTTQATNSLDVNKASLLLIHSMIPELSADAMERISKRRSDESLGGEFKDEADFWNFVNTLGNYDDAKKKFSERGLKILQPADSYHVVVTAQSGSANRTWLADVGPLPPKLADQSSSGTPQSSSAQPNPNSTSTSTSTSTTTTAENGDIDSLNIVYLRAE